MALQKQTQSLPLVAGVNQKEDALLTNRPTAMVNCLYRKSLAAGDKRFGHECIAPGAIGDDPENLTTCGDSLVGIGCGRLYEFDTYANGGSGWATRARVPEAIVREQDIAVSALQLVADQAPDVAYCNGYIITLYYFEPDAGDINICVDVVNATSGARVFSQYILSAAAAGETLHYPQLAVSGTTVGAFWVYDKSATSTTRIEGRFLDTTTMTWATKGTVVTGTASPGGLGGGVRPFAVDVISSTAWVFAYEDDGASGNDVRLTAVNTSFSTTLGPLTFAASSTDIVSFAVKVAPTGASAGVWVAYGDRSGDVYTARATLALVESLARTLVTNGAFGGICYNVTIEWYSNAYFEVFIACSFVGASTWYIEWNGFTALGAKSHVSNKVAWNVQLASKAFRVEQTTGTGVYRIYGWVQNQHTTHTTHFLIDFYTNPTEALPTTTVCRVVATALPRYGYGRQVTRTSSLSSVAALGTYDFICAAGVTLTDQRTRQIFGLRTLFHSDWQRTCVDTPGGLVIGGGAPHLFDGVYAWEVGFFNEPDLGAMATFTSSNSTGSLTNSGVYSYIAVYAVRDGKGNIHRSAPSAVKAGPRPSMGASDDTIQGTVPPLHLTNRSDGTTTNPIMIELYRTLNNGSTYYFCQAIRNDPSASAAIAFTDEMSDATLATKPILYSTGGVLERTAPESAALAHSHKNAVVLGDTASGNVWFSGELLDDEGMWFSEAATVAPFEGGRVTAMATMDQSMIAFKTESIYGFDGEPPSDVGVSTLSSPRRIQSDVGCIDPHSVVGGDMGVFFYGRTGLALLTRGYAVEPIGKPIEDSYSSTTQTRRFAGACLVPGQNLIRFVQYNESTAAALNYDYYHSKLYGTPVWSTDNFYDVTAGGGAADKAYAACMWRNRFVYLTDDRRLIGEKAASSSTAYLDTDYSGSTQTWVPMTVTSPAAKGAGVQGRQRVWRASVLGVKGSDHGVSVTLTSDLGTTTRTWSRTEVNAAVTGTAEQLQVHNDKQKCQWLSISYTDTDPGNGNRGNGRGMTLRSFDIEFGVKPGLAKNIPQGARK